MNLTLDNTSFLPQSEPKVPGQTELSQSGSFLSPPSPPALSNHSTEHINYNDNSSSLWTSNIWAQGPVSKPKQPPFRPDRSMSLTEASSGLFSSFRHPKNLEGFPSAPASAVPPPPGFPPSSSLLAQVQPMVSTNRYKTELCRGFQETGTCKYGSKCQFAHGEAELRGLYRHPKYKTEPCRTFYNFGYCPYGSRCHFIHEDKISGASLTSAKFQNQVAPTARHQLRQSVSFAGFVGPSRSSSPPSFPVSFNDLNMGFTRAPSVSPPPADLLSPVFGDSLQNEAVAFQFGSHQTRKSTGDIHNIPLILEPKTSCCVCGHGNTSNGGGGGGDSNTKTFANMEDGHNLDNQLFPGAGGHRAYTKPASLQRFSSEDSLEDSYSSSGGSSGTESPTFDSANTKRLMVFERLSLSD